MASLVIQIAFVHPDSLLDGIFTVGKIAECGLGSGLEQSQDSYHVG